jgi:hypothetical protein
MLLHCKASSVVLKPELLEGIADVSLLVGFKTAWETFFFLPMVSINIKIRC